MSGAQESRELCLAARNEERRLAELNKRREYQKPRQAVTQNQGFQKNNDRSGESRGWRKSQSATTGGDSREQRDGKRVPNSADHSNRRCFKCHKFGHISKDCQALRPESDGRERRDKSGTTNQVQSHSHVG